MRATTKKYRFCIKKLRDPHEVVRSVSLKYIPQEKKVMKIALSFTACGDITGNCDGCVHYYKLHLLPWLLKLVLFHSYFLNTFQHIPEIGTRMK